MDPAGTNSQEWLNWSTFFENLITDCVFFSLSYSFLHIWVVAISTEAFVTGRLDVLKSQIFPFVVVSFEWTNARPFCYGDGKRNLGTIVSWTYRYLPPRASTNDFDVERPTPIPEVSPPSCLSPDFKIEKVSKRPEILWAGIPFPKSVITVVNSPNLPGKSSSWSAAS